MRTLANSENPDEMSHNVTFHLGLHCLLNKKKDLQRKKYNILEVINCDPSIYTLYHPSNFVTCTSCIFFSIFCLWDAKFLFQGVPGCNGIVDLS